ncbi:MAG: hypothetical protein ACREH4_15290 [Vitreimonas sp.]
MRGWLAAVLLACLAGLSAAPARAQADHPLLTQAPRRCGGERCEGLFYRSDQLEFGRHQIGAATHVCDRCEFVEAGVRYFVVRGRIDAMRIDVGGAATLPFGLRGDESPAAALAALQRVTSIPLEVSGREDGDRTVTVQGSLKNAIGRPERFNLVFTPEDRLYMIEMYAPR